MGPQGRPGPQGSPGPTGPVGPAGRDNTTTTVSALTMFRTKTLASEPLAVEFQNDQGYLYCEATIQSNADLRNDYEFFATVSVNGQKVGSTNYGNWLEPGDRWRSGYIEVGPGWAKAGDKADCLVQVRKDETVQASGKTALIEVQAAPARKYLMGEVGAVVLRRSKQEPQKLEAKFDLAYIEKGASAGVLLPTKCALGLRVDKAQPDLNSPSHEYEFREMELKTEWVLLPHEVSAQKDPDETYVTCETSPNWEIRKTQRDGHFYYFESRPLPFKIEKAE